MPTLNACSSSFYPRRAAVAAAERPQPAPATIELRLSPDQQVPLSAIQPNSRGSGLTFGRAVGLFRFRLDPRFCGASFCPIGKVAICIQLFAGLGHCALHFCPLQLPGACFPLSRDQKGAREAPSAALPRIHFTEY
jgi:hypothetical protein